MVRLARNGKTEREMKLPSWFKITWWVFIMGAVTYLVVRRFDSLMSTSPSAMDIVIFLIWIALLTIPLFQEVSFFGVSLKKEFDSLKSEVKEQIINLRSDIQNTVNIYPYSPPPPSDSELPAIQKKILDAVEQAWKQGKIQIAIEEEKPELEVSEDVQFLFSVRLKIENELKRIWREMKLARRPVVTTFGMLRALDEIGFPIEPDLSKGIREVYSICSAAIHGEDVSKAKVNFVRDVAPKLIVSLKTTKIRDQ